ncbi:MAG: prephenate dehydratase [Acidimicrobiales bacterium]
MTPAAASAPDASQRVGFLGPAGTFTEQALLTQPDLCRGELVPLPSIPDVLAAAGDGRVDLGFVAIENAIEGTVNVTQDTLAFEADLLIQREVVIPVELCLLGVAGAPLDGVTRVISFPHATAQCRGFLARSLPAAATDATNSTADAARSSPTPVTRRAPPSPRRAAEVYGLDVLAASIADHPENATRFVVVAPHGIPAPTGHDKTSIVVYQRADAPGSLLGILQEFAARNINLSKLESRPTKTGLGDYCFLIDLDGHVDDEVVADVLRTLKSKQGDVKFLGSYPAAGEHGPEVRREADASGQAAAAWLDALRAEIRR